MTNNRKINLNGLQDQFNIYNYFEKPKLCGMDGLINEHLVGIQYDDVIGFT